MTNFIRRNPHLDPAYISACALRAGPLDRPEPEQRKHGAHAEQVDQYDGDRLVATHASATDAARSVRRNREGIYQAINRGLACGGYRWAWHGKKPKEKRKRWCEIHRISVVYRGQSYPSLIALADALGMARSTVYLAFTQNRLVAGAPVERVKG